MKGRALVAWNLRRTRVRRGLSQERLAFDAGVDRSYVGGLERREENPTIDLLDRLALVLFFLTTTSQYVVARKATAMVDWTILSSTFLKAMVEWAGA